MARKILPVLGQPPDEACGLCEDGVPLNPEGTAHRLAGNDLVDFACTSLPTGMIPCETCEGRGEVRALCVRTATGSGPGEMQCPACRGSGKVDARHEAWARAGEAMRADRLARDLSLREEAIRRGVSAAVLSDMELGRIEPKPEAPRG